MTGSNLSRRQFLKLAALAGASTIAPSPTIQSQSDRPNVLIVVFDAWSAENVSLYGYPRQTMPNLEKLANRAVVYHNHYAGGPWTVPGTGSLLTGTYPWTHRGFTVAENNALPAYTKQNIFSQFNQAGYYTSGYSHNIFADQYLYQFGSSINQHISRNDLFLEHPYLFLSNWFPKDPDAAAVAELRMYAEDDDYHSSVFLERLLHTLTTRTKEQQNDLFAEQFPRGLPATPVPEMSFLLEEGIDHIVRASTEHSGPYLSYYHFYPPHQPYRTRTEFDGAFKNDGISFIEKPNTIINEGAEPNRINKARQTYDEFLLYVDAEFFRLYTSLEHSGLLENTWVVLTSDHGEMFERGNIGHETLTGLDPAIHIPLLIFPPGQSKRVDVFETTSAVDVLPTLLEIAGLPAADWTEGLALPPFSAAPLPADRAVYCLHPGDSVSKRPISQGAATIIKEGYKFFSVFGDKRLGEHDPYLALYDLAADPEELNNLIEAQPEIAAQLYQQLQAVMEAADRPFRR